MIIKASKILKSINKDTKRNIFFISWFYNNTHNMIIWIIGIWQILAYSSDFGWVGWPIWLFLWKYSQRELVFPLSHTENILNRKTELYMCALVEWYFWQFLKPCQHCLANWKSYPSTSSSKRLQDLRHHPESDRTCSWVSWEKYRASPLPPNCCLISCH